MLPLVAASNLFGSNPAVVKTFTEDVTYNGGAFFSAVAVAGKVYNKQSENYESPSFDVNDPAAALAAAQSPWLTFGAARTITRRWLAP